MLLDLIDSPPLRAKTQVSPFVAACRAVSEAEGITLRPTADLSGSEPDAARRLARTSGVRSRRVLLQGEWWKQDAGAMLAALEEDRKPVALLPRRSMFSGFGYTIFDPAAGTSIPVDAASARLLDGFAETFYRPLPEGRITPGALLRFGLRGSGRELAIVAIAGLLVSLLALALPLATGVVFDSILPAGERDQLTQMAALILATAVSSSMFALLRGFALLRIEGRADYTLQAAVWDRLLDLPATFFRNFPAGDLASRSLAVSQLRASLDGNTITGLVAGIFSLFSGALLFHYSPAAAALALALVLASLAVTLFAGLAQFRLQTTLMRLSGRLSGMAFGIVNGIPKLRATAAEDRAFDRWATAFADQKRVSIAVRRITNRISVFNRAFPTLTLCVVYWTLASRLRLEGNGSGQILGFIAAFGQLAAGVRTFGAGALAVLRAVPLYRRLSPLLEAMPEQQTGRLQPGELCGGIELDGVSFSYGGPQILNDLSLNIRPGEFVAIVGPSGSGKSTLLRLLLGFETPAIGSVRYDGLDLRDLDVQEVRRQLGTVLQNGTVMAGDILTNIIGTSRLTVDDAWAAARLAGLEDDLRALPMGMFTLVTEGGRELSGGQRQRLMIARAFAARPKILLFDEATSALDNRTQEIVTAAMEQTRATRVVIAHRLSTILKADRIIVMNAGSIVEAGNFEELIARKGFFAQLAERQMQ